MTCCSYTPVDQWSQHSNTCYSRTSKQYVGGVAPTPILRRNTGLYALPIAYPKQAWFKHGRPHPLWGIFPRLAFEVFQEKEDGWKITMKYFQNVVSSRERLHQCSNFPTARRFQPGESNQ